MKKGILLVILGLFMLTGCGSVKTMECTRTIEQNNIAMDLRYEIEYKNSYAQRVKSTEKVTTDSKDILDSYKKSIENMYAPYKDIEHYDYNVSIEGNTLTSTADINYAEIDVDKFTKIDSANSQLFENGKVKLDTLIATYEALGATCKK